MLLYLFICVFWFSISPILKFYFIKVVQWVKWIFCSACWIYHCLITSYKLWYQKHCKPTESLFQTKETKIIIILNYIWSNQNIYQLSNFHSYRSKSKLCDEQLQHKILSVSDASTTYRNIACYHIQCLPGTVWGAEVNSKKLALYKKLISIIIKIRRSFVPNVQKEDKMN